MVKKSVSFKLPKAKTRNSCALPASTRNSAGPMHDKRKKRGGSKNEQAELKKELDDEESDS